MYFSSGFKQASLITQGIFLIKTVVFFRSSRPFYRYTDLKLTSLLDYLPSVLCAYAWPLFVSCTVSEGVHMQ